jgi:Domain of unknown function (DUF4136)
MNVLRALVPLLILSSYTIAQDVNYNFDQSADFSKFKTYKWVQIKGADTLDELTGRQLKAALDAELAKKGLAQTDGDNADLFIGYQVALNQEKQFTSYDTGWGYGPRWGMGGGTMQGQTSTIRIGTLVVDFYDAAKHELVWRGTASKSLDPKANAEKRQKNIEKAVAKLLKKYPPQEKKS